VGHHKYGNKETGEIIEFDKAKPEQTGQKTVEPDDIKDPIPLGKIFS
jgi:hypothetical protein